jgi:hypothetical protein
LAGLPVRTGFHKIADRRQPLGQGLDREVAAIEASSTFFHVTGVEAPAKARAL